MFRFILIFICLSFSIEKINSQEPESPPGWLKSNVLGAENIREYSDTGQVKVVSASRSTKYISDLPITIYVVTHDEIIRNQHTTLTDVLKSLPGIRVSTPGSGELGNSYQVRGLTGNFYTKILLNGLPVKPSVVSGMPLDAQLPVRQAERIEIIYGPGAAIYGADAVSGVINIITRQAEEGTFVQGDISLGQSDFNYINFIIGGKAGKNRNILNYSFYGSKNELSDLMVTRGYSDAYNPLSYLQNTRRNITLNSVDYRPLEITADVLQNESINKQNFISEYYPERYEGDIQNPELENLPAYSHMIGLQLAFRGLRLSYDNMYRRSHSSIGRSPYLFKYNNPQNYWGDIIQRVTLSYDLAISPVIHSSTHLSNLWYNMDSNSSLGVTFLENTDKVYLFSSSHDFLAEQVFTLTPGKNIESVTGITYQRSRNFPLTNYLYSPWDYKNYGMYDNFSFPYDSLLGYFGFNPQKFTELSGFTQLYWLLKRYTFMGGLRFDKRSNLTTIFSPRFAMLYKYSEITSLFGSIGFAYKSAPANLAWQSVAYPAPEDPSLIRYMVVPNPDLIPEKFRATELGIRTRFAKRMDINLSIYYNEINNLIMEKYVKVESLSLPKAYSGSPLDSLLFRENISGSVSRLYGIQATARWKNVIQAVKLDLELSLSFAQKSEKIPGLTDIPNLLGGFKLMPRHFGQLKASLYPVERLYFNIESAWMSKWLRVIIPFEDLFPDLFRDVDGFYLMDVNANYRVGENLRLFIKANNLFDEKYGGLGVTGQATDLPYNPQMRRHIRIGLTYNLN